MKGLYAPVSETEQAMDREKGYSLVYGNDINVSVEESIAEDDTADTTCGTSSSEYMRPMGRQH